MSLEYKFNIWRYSYKFILLTSSDMATNVLLLILIQSCVHYTQIWYPLIFRAGFYYYFILEIKNHETVG